MLAQRRRQWPRNTQVLCQCICYLGSVSSAGMESVTYIAIQQSPNTVQSPNAVSIPGQRRRLWVKIKTALGEWHVYADVLTQSIQQTQCLISVGQGHRRLIGIAPVMGCDASPKLNRNLVSIGLLYVGYRRDTRNY